MLQVHFEKLAELLAANEAKIDAALIAVQGEPLDTGGSSARSGQDSGSDGRFS